MVLSRLEQEPMKLTHRGLKGKSVMKEGEGSASMKGRKDSLSLI